MICPREKLRRLGSGNPINLDINKIVSLSNFINPESDKFSGVIRFKERGDRSIMIPRYKALVLVNNKVYAYRMIGINNVFDISNYSEVIEFNSTDEAIYSWNKSIKNPIINE